MSTQKIRELSNTLSLTSRTRATSKNWLNTRSKIHTQRQNSRRRYEHLTNHSLDGQKALINHTKSARRSQWKHDYYKISNTFNPFDRHDFQPFPHNNEKYNVQFLDRSLRGKSLKFPAKDWGYFQPPKDKLFSEHFRPIVRGKRKYNEDYQLRTSLFGQTILDVKRDHIIDEYKLQANPFRTPASNALISTMYKQKHNHRDLGP